MSTAFVVAGNSYPRASGLSVVGRGREPVIGAGGEDDGSGFAFTRPGDGSKVRFRKGKTTLHPLPDDKSQFLLRGANGKAMKWLADDDGAVGVMIVGNFGRRGGKCMDEYGNFEELPDADTQEESALSMFVHYNRNMKAVIEGGLTTVGGNYRMDPPNGDETDFLVHLDNNPNGKMDNIQTAGPEIYSREYGFWLDGWLSRKKRPKGVYLSFAVFSISACDTLVTLVTSKCHKGLGAV